MKYTITNKITGRQIFFNDLVSFYEYFKLDMKDIICGHHEIYSYESMNNGVQPDENIAKLISDIAKLISDIAGYDIREDDEYSICD